MATAGLGAPFQPPDRWARNAGCGKSRGHSSAAVMGLVIVDLSRVRTDQREHRSRTCRRRPISAIARTPLPSGSGPHDLDLCARRYRTTRSTSHKAPGGRAPWPHSVRSASQSDDSNVGAHRTTSAAASEVAQRVTEPAIGAHDLALGACDSSRHRTTTGEAVTHLERATEPAFGAC